MGSLIGSIFAWGWEDTGRPLDTRYFQDPSVGLVESLWPLVGIAAILGWVFVYVLHRLLPRPSASLTRDRKATDLSISFLDICMVVAPALTCLISLILLRVVGLISAAPLVFILGVVGFAGWAVALGQLVSCAVHSRQLDRLPLTNVSRKMKPHEEKPQATVPTDAVQSRPDDDRFTR